MGLNFFHLSKSKLKIILKISYKEIKLHFFSIPQFVLLRALLLDKNTQTNSLSPFYQKNEENRKSNGNEIFQS